MKITAATTGTRVLGLILAVFAPAIVVTADDLTIDSIDGGGCFTSGETPSIKLVSVSGSNLNFGDTASVTVGRKYIQYVCVILCLSHCQAISHLTFAFFLSHPIPITLNTILYRPSALKRVSRHLFCLGISNQGGHYRFATD
jgi:hypothetical protein